MARPLEYNQEIVIRAQEYLNSCKDSSKDDGRTTKVNIPTKGGLAVHLDVSRETLYDWAKKYPEFSDIMEKLGAEQESRLINNGLAGTYNSTIAKVLLTKHGYTDKMDVTSKDEKLPTPIFAAIPQADAISIHNSDEEDTETE